MANSAANTQGNSRGRACPAASLKPSNLSTLCSSPSTVSFGLNDRTSAKHPSRVVSPVKASSSSSSAFPLWHFLHLVALTGFLASVASVLGKLACDFGPGAPLQLLSDSLLHRLVPQQSTSSDRLLLRVGEDCSLEAFETRPGGFPALVTETGRALLLAISFHDCSTSSGNGQGEPSGSPSQVGACIWGLLCFFSLVLLCRISLFLCMLGCNALMLQFHVKCLVAAPSSCSSSVSIFAANFLCSVVLSWLLLGEQLTLQFLLGAVCMLLGVALLSLTKDASPLENQEDKKRL
ncbi:hypothetical protein cyc_05796 [Cyclospora cayetanensis]|uniref:Transmembrane protein n=1 Tax=Cyclospora cayetanensis TaxID=88456 RepID=A0A1D3CVK1_9EIME|nr:hypothetical protein cyc_05796 [Cyclospora cayetanensis]